MRQPFKCVIIGLYLLLEAISSRLPETLVNRIQKPMRGVAAVFPKHDAGKAFVQDITALVKQRFLVVVGDEMITVEQERGFGFVVPEPVVPVPIDVFRC
jgi:hypothetical protein